VGGLAADDTITGLPYRNALIVESAAGVFTMPVGRDSALGWLIPNAVAFPTPPPALVGGHSIIGTHYWLTAGAMQGGSLIVGAEWVGTASPAIPNALNGVLLGHHLHTVNPSTWAASSVVEVDGPDAQSMFGQFLVDAGFVYVIDHAYDPPYSTDATDPTSDYYLVQGGVVGPRGYLAADRTTCRIARVPDGSLTTPSAWRWWDGSGWRADQLAAAPLLDTAGEPLSGDTALRRTRAGFVLAVMPLAAGVVRLYRSGYPWGPWEQYATAPVPTGIEHYGSVSVGYQTAWAPHLDPSTSELMLIWSGNFAGAQPPTTPGTDMDPDWACPHHLVVPAPTFGVST